VKADIAYFRHQEATGYRDMGALPDAATARAALGIAEPATETAPNGAIREAAAAPAAGGAAPDAAASGFGAKNKRTTKDDADAARKAIADRLTNPDRNYSGLDPELMGHLGTIADYYLEGSQNKLKDFLADAKELLGTLHDTYAPALRKLYEDKFAAKQEPPADAVPAAGGFTTGTQNAVQESERIARSKDPIAKEFVIANEETAQSARAAMDADPNLADALVSRLRGEGPRKISTVEEGVLLLHKVDLMNERQAEMVRIKDTSFTKEQREAAGQRWDSLEERISKIDEATHASGAEWGRFGQFRQRLLRDDYSFEALERKDRKLKGRPLTKDESGKLEEMAKDHAAAKAEVDRLNGELAKVRQEKETLAYHNEVLKELEKYKERTGPPTDFTPPKKTKPKVVEMADSWIEAAMKRKAERSKAGMMFSNPVPEFADDAIIGTAYLVKGAYKFGEWSAKMVESLGDYIKPHLEELWDIAKARATNQMGEGTRDIAGERKATVEAMKEAAGEGATLDDLGKYAKALHRQFIEEGMTDFHRIKDAIHAELEQVFPGISADESLRAWTDYGTFTLLDKTDPNEVLRRETRQEGQKFAKIQSLLRGEPRERTGREMQKPSPLARQFEKQANELARRLGIQITDPETQLKSSLDAIKTRLSNEIEDMNYAIATGKKLITERTTVPYDAEATELKRQRDEKKKDYAALFPKEPITLEEQIRRATKIAERNAEQWQKNLDDARAGNFPKKAKPTPITSPELEAIRANIKAAKAEVKTLRDLANPKKSDAEKSLQASLAAKLRRVADLQDRIARKDFAPRTKKPAAVAVTPEEKALEANRDAATVQQKQVEIDYKRARAKWEQSQQGRAQRTMEGITKWNRALMLTGLPSIAKLTSAAGAISAFAPVEQAVGAGIGKAMPWIAERAPSKGRFQFSTEGKAVVETFRNLMKDAKDIWKTGNSDLDLLYGKPDIFPPEFKDYIGRIHAALKSPAKRNQWVRSFEYRMQHAEREATRNGVPFDPKDPMTQLRIGNEAYKEALSSIFYDDNLVVSAYKWALNSLEQHKDPTTGQMTFGASATKMAAKIQLAIVRIPTNIVARTFEYSLGTGMGTLRIGRAAMRGILGEKAANGTWKLREGVRRGIDDLHPDEANAIIRNLARGSLGSALLLVGFFNPQAVGGYYVRGQKRDESEVKEGELRMFGHNVKKYFIHTPLLEQLQIGSTIRKVMDSKLHKKDAENQGITPAIKAAAMGLINQVPFVSEADTYSRLKESEGGTKFVADTLSRAIPQLVKERAKEGIPGLLEADTDSKGNPVRRDPKTLMERVKINIPGLRQSVPEKKTKSLFKYGSSGTSSGKQLPWEHVPTTIW